MQNRKRIINNNTNILTKKTYIRKRAKDLTCKEETTFCKELTLEI